MRCFFENNHILHQTSCLYTKQNEVVEKKLRHILSIARSLLFQFVLPIKILGEVVLTSIFLINRMPISVLNSLSPYDFKKRFMFFDYLRVFGCLCFATKLNNFDKFLEMADKFVLLG